MGEVIPLHRQVLLTQKEFEQFQSLKVKLENSISPGEARFYKNELDVLIEIGKQRYLQKHQHPNH